MIDVGEGVRGERDFGQHLLVRGSRRMSSSTPIASPRLVTGANTRAVRAVFDARRLGGERAAVRASHQRHALGGLAALSARGGAAAGVTEPDERMAAEVRDEERHLARAELAREPLAEHVGGGERRGVLDGREQLREIQPR